MCFVISVLYGDIDINTKSATEGMSDGSIVVVLSGDAGPFEVVLYDTCDEESRVEIDRYSRKEGGRFTFDELEGGMYAVYIVDRLDCETCTDVTIEEEPIPCDIRIELREMQHVTSCEICEEDASYNNNRPCTNDGFIEILLLPEEGSYNISWTGPGGSVYSGSRIEDLSDGSYQVTVSDGDCQESKSYYVGVCDILTLVVDDGGAHCETVHMLDPRVARLEEIKVGHAVSAPDEGYPLPFKWIGTKNKFLDYIDEATGRTVDLKTVLNLRGKGFSDYKKILNGKLKAFNNGDYAEYGASSLEIHFMVPPGYNTNGLRSEIQKHFDDWADLYQPLPDGFVLPTFEIGEFLD